MRSFMRIQWVVLGLSFMTSIPSLAGSTFTYQGQLRRAGVPLTGTANIRCVLYNEMTGGSAVAGPLTINGVNVVDGLFMIELDFGAAVFDGSPRYIEISVADDQGGDYSTLAPRQMVSSAPQAIFSDNTRGLSVDSTGNVGIGTPTPAARLTVMGTLDPNGTAFFSSPKGPMISHVHYGDTGDWYVRSADVTGKVILQDAGGNVGIGTSAPTAKLHIGGSPGLDGIRFPDGTLQTTAAGAAGWNLTGNSGTNSGLHFLGTTDSAPVSLRVNNLPALRLQFGSNGPLTGVNVVGGAGSNSIPNNVVGATVFGGTTFLGNSVNADWSTVGGGLGCSVSSSADKSVVAGGQNNVANGSTSVISGGASNTTGGITSTVAGGASNNASQLRSTIGGGGFNTANGPNAVIAGGFQNTAGDTCAVGGGQQNLASGWYASIGGGNNNVANSLANHVGGGQQNRAGIVANDEYATVGGGFSNLAGWRSAVLGGAGNGATGSYSFAGAGQGNTASGNYTMAGGGYLNVASGPYAVVSGGGQNTASGLRSVVAGGDQNRAAGQNSFSAGHRALADHAGAFVWADHTDADFASTADQQFLVRASGGVGINTNNPAGFALNVAGNISCTNLTQTSDARFKTNVAGIENALGTILDLRGVTFEWDCSASDRHFPVGRQIGFIAQEVEEVLPEIVTTDSNGSKSVAYANVVPVLVEAVKAQANAAQLQNHLVDDAMISQQQGLNALRLENQELRVRLEKLEAMLMKAAKRD